MSDLSLFSKLVEIAVGTHTRRLTYLLTMRWSLAWLESILYGDRGGYSHLYGPSVLSVNCEVISWAEVYSKKEKESKKTCYCYSYWRSNASV